MALNIKIFDESFRGLLNILFDQLRINFFAIDKDGFYIARNKTLTNIVGETERADRIDKKSWDTCLEIMRTGKHQVVEEEYNGQWFLSCKSPLSENGNIIGVIGVAVNISDKKQAEIAKNEFLENMSHDLRTPFSGIISLSQYLHDSEADPARKELLGDVLISGKKLLELLNQVIELSTRGSHPIAITEVNLHDVIKEAVDLIYAELTHKGLLLNVSCPPISIPTDRMRLSRILLNIVSNAVKYTHKGSVSISVSVNPHITIKIEDTGIGIPSDKLDVIFDRFTKVQPAYIQSSFTGAGIGLNISREFAKEIGAKLTVSSAVNEGTCFTIDLLKNNK